MHADGPQVAGVTPVYDCVGPYSDSSGNTTSQSSGNQGSNIDVSPIINGIQNGENLDQAIQQIQNIINQAEDGSSDTPDDTPDDNAADGSSDSPGDTAASPDTPDSAVDETPAPVEPVVINSPTATAPDSAVDETPTPVETVVDNSPTATAPDSTGVRGGVDSLLGAGSAPSSDPSVLTGVNDLLGDNSSNGANSDSAVLQGVDSLLGDQSILSGAAGSGNLEVFGGVAANSNDQNASVLQGVDSVLGGSNPPQSSNGGNDANSQPELTPGEAALTTADKGADVVAGALDKELAAAQANSNLSPDQLTTIESDVANEKGTLESLGNAAKSLDIVNDVDGVIQAQNSGDAQDQDQAKLKFYSDAAGVVIGELAPSLAKFAASAEGAPLVLLQSTDTGLDPGEIVGDDHFAYPKQQAAMNQMYSWFNEASPSVRNSQIPMLIQETDKFVNSGQLTPDQRAQAIENVILQYNSHKDIWSQQQIQQLIQLASELQSQIASGQTLP
jgi:hypothetical protein